LGYIFLVSVLLKIPINENTAAITLIKPAIKPTPNGFDAAVWLGSWGNIKNPYIDSKIAIKAIIIEMTPVCWVSILLIIKDTLTCSFYPYFSLTIFKY